MFSLLGHLAVSVATRNVDEPNLDRLPLLKADALNKLFYIFFSLVFMRSADLPVFTLVTIGSQVVAVVTCHAVLSLCVLSTCDYMFTLLGLYPVSLSQLKHYLAKCYT